MRRRGRKILSCDLLLNYRISANPAWQRASVRFHDHDQAPIATPSIVILQIGNLGVESVKRQDYEVPIEIGFTGRRVEAVNVTEGHPSELAQAIARHVTATEQRVVLPAEDLDPGNRFTLLILLSGDSHDDTVEITGTLNDGNFVNARRLPNRKVHAP
ncbi:hypothetical protein ACN28C_28710 [Plantactinospora sp. WMMC1484]|uniref:hypothetical protein n=1 Tax=Plantactinospora sp. WMMC1484 TaxID=3404122 RepID=UPI003BF5B788